MGGKLPILSPFVPIIEKNDNGQHAPSFPNSPFPRSRSGQKKNKFGPQSKNLASIIRGFKSAVTTNARKSQVDFAWQARFHAHIIQNEMAYKRIAHYIRKNPEEWGSNKFS
jgi:hypothetical protein